MVLRSFTPALIVVPALLLAAATTQAQSTPPGATPAGATPGASPSAAPSLAPPSWFDERFGEAIDEVQKGIKNGKKDLKVWIDRNIGDPERLEPSTVDALKRLPEELLVSLMRIRMSAKSGSTRPLDAPGIYGVQMAGANPVELMQGLRTQFGGFLNENQIADIAATLVVRAPLGIDVRQFPDEIVDRFAGPAAPAVLAGMIYGDNINLKLGGTLVRPKDDHGAFLDTRLRIDHFGASLNPELMTEVGTGYSFEKGTAVRLKLGAGHFDKKGMPRYETGLGFARDQLHLDTTVYWESAQTGNFVPWSHDDRKQGGSVALQYGDFMLGGRYGTIRRADAKDWDADGGVSYTWRKGAGYVTASGFLQRGSPISGTGVPPGVSGRVAVNADFATSEKFKVAGNGTLVVTPACGVGLTGYAAITHLASDVRGIVEAFRDPATGETRVIAAIGGPLEPPNLSEDSSLSILRHHALEVRRLTGELKRHDPPLDLNEAAILRDRLKVELAHFRELKKAADAKNFKTHDILDPHDEHEAEVLSGSGQS